MIYLGASFAAGGKDKEAAGVWRTALIREGNAARFTSCSPTRSCVRGEAISRSRISNARDRWPDDVGLKRRFAVAAMLAGQRAEGLKVLEELIASKADDETV